MREPRAESRLRPDASSSWLEQPPEASCTVLQPLQHLVDASGIVARFAARGRCGGATLDACLGVLRAKRAAAAAARAGALYGTYEAFRYKVPGLYKVRYIGQVRSAPRCHAMGLLSCLCFQSDAAAAGPRAMF